MKAVILYDSFFGNTEKIARAIGSAFEIPHECQVVRIDDFKPDLLKGINLLILGSPTRQFSPSPKINQFVKTLPAASLTGIKGTSFDTRIALEDIQSPLLRFLAKMFSYAAPSMANGLVKKGLRLAAEPQGFYVKESEGPLKDGEIERSIFWAKSFLQ